MFTDARNLNPPKLADAHCYICQYRNLTPLVDVYPKLDIKVH